MIGSSHHSPNIRAFLCTVALPGDIGLSDPPGGLYNREDYHHSRLLSHLLSLSFDLDLYLTCWFASNAILRCFLRAVSSSAGIPSSFGVICPSRTLFSSVGRVPH
jgi:hypothetical protein